MTERKKPAKPATVRLQELDQAVIAAKARVREVERRAQEAQRKADQLREEVTEAFARGDEAAADKLHAERLKADAAAAGPWQERVVGARRAAQRASARKERVGGSARLDQRIAGFGWQRGTSFGRARHHAAASLSADGGQRD